MIAKTHHRRHPPKPSEIRRRCAEIRRGWNEETRRARIVFPTIGFPTGDRTPVPNRLRELGLDAEVSTLLLERLFGPREA
jgi:hypothetical protein